MAACGAELVDMECFFLARICALRGIAMSALKVTTDLADENTGTHVAGNLRPALQKLTDALLRTYMKTGKDT
jgi:nucleoside phosphorylase